MRHGERMFYVYGQWHRNEWNRGPLPRTIAFRNGGGFREGRNIGFDNAERINARFRPANREIHEDHQERHLRSVQPFLPAARRKPRP